MSPATHSIWARHNGYCPQALPALTFELTVTRLLHTAHLLTPSHVHCTSNTIRTTHTFFWYKNYPRQREIKAYLSERQERQRIIVLPFCAFFTRSAYNERIIDRHCYCRSVPIMLRLQSSVTNLN